MFFVVDNDDASGSDGDGDGDDPSGGDGDGDDVSDGDGDECFFLPKYLTASCICFRSTRYHPAG